MAKLQLTFSGRRTISSQGDNIRINTNNGNVIISESIAKELGLSIGDHVNFTDLDGTVYMKIGDGFKLGKKFSLTSANVAATFEKAFEKEAEGKGVIYATVDFDNPIEATTEDEDGNDLDITVYSVKFEKAEKARTFTRKDGTLGTEGEEEEEEEEEEEAEEEV